MLLPCPSRVRLNGSGVKCKERRCGRTGGLESPEVTWSARVDRVKDNGTKGRTGRVCVSVRC